MYKSHPRYREIERIALGTNECPQGGSPLGIVLFPRDEDLRAHVVRHMLNTYEYEQAWGRIAKTPWSEFSDCVNSLKDLGCPIVETERISCFTGSGRCEKFDECGSFLTRLESVYLDCTEKVVESAMTTPRYACFWDEGGSSFLWIQPDWKLTAKAVFKNGTYVIMTCYSPTPRFRLKQISWQEIRDYVRREAQNEAFQRRVVWRTEETWAPELKKKVGGDGNETSRGGKGPGRPHVNSRKKNWREYLSEYLEEEDER